MSGRKQELKRNIEDLTRRSILSAALDLVEKEGLSKCTMDKVAEKAEFAKGTLYLYFKNKKALLDSLIEFCFEPLEEISREIIASDISPTEKLNKCILATAQFVHERREIFRELADQTFRPIYDDYVDKQSWFWRVVKLYAGIIEAGIEKGEMRPVNSEKAAAYLIGAFDVMIADIVILNDYENAEEAAKISTDIFINGIVLQ